MGLWIIEPVAAADDPAWQGRRQWQRVLVRAKTAADARLAAERLEQSGGEAEPSRPYPGQASGFSSETLYHVRPADSPQAEPVAAAVPEGDILEAEARPV